MYDLVKIINTAPLKGKLSRDLVFNVSTDERIVLEPGAERIVRFDVAAAVFGHPLLRDNGPKDRARVAGYDQLRFYWGFHNGFDTETEKERLANVNADYIGSWERKMPPFRVETLEGEWVPMVLDDPVGNEPLPGQAALPSISATEANVAVLQAQLAQTQRQLEQLTALIVSQQGGTPLSAELSGLSDDDDLGDGSDDATIPDPADGSGAEHDEPSMVPAR